MKIPSPSQFEKLAKPISYGLLVLSLGGLAAGSWLALWRSPPDYLQGESVRMMYIHVPSAWLAMSLYAVLAIAAAAFLYKGWLLAAVLARAVTPIGIVATCLTILSGSLWGRLSWGAYWVWDARLTAVVVLLFFYLGYAALADAFDDRRKGRKLASVLAVFGMINLPIIKFSVDWWNTLHQPASLSKFNAPNIDESMLLPLLLMAASLTAYAAAVVLTLMRGYLAEMRR